MWYCGRERRGDGSYVPKIPLDESTSIYLSTNIHKYVFPIDDIHSIYTGISYPICPRAKNEAVPNSVNGQ